MVNEIKVRINGVEKVFPLVEKVFKDGKGAKGFYCGGREEFSGVKYRLNLLIFEMGSKPRKEKVE